MSIIVIDINWMSMTSLVLYIKLESFFAILNFIFSHKIGPPSALNQESDLKSGMDYSYYQSMWSTENRLDEEWVFTPALLLQN